MTDEDRKAQKAVEERKKEKSAGAGEHPPAGPHAKEHLTDESKTPGAGSLPGAKEGSVDPGSG
jgi:hypothetical protein